MTQNPICILKLLEWVKKDSLTSNGPIIFIEGERQVKSDSCLLKILLACAVLPIIYYAFVVVANKYNLTLICMQALANAESVECPCLPQAQSQSIELAIPQAEDEQQSAKLQQAVGQSIL